MPSLSPQMQLVLLFAMLWYIPVDRQSMQPKWFPRVFWVLLFWF